MEIGKIIKKYREDNDLTMQQIADRSGLSKGYISMLEKGRHPQNNRPIIPSIETVQKLAAAMHMTIDALLELCGSDQLIEVPENESSSSPDSLFIEKYGRDSFDVFVKFLQLDAEDRIRISERIDILLEADKYKRDSFVEKAI